MISDREAIERMHAFLSGSEWDSGTIETVAWLIESTGRIITPVPPQFTPNQPLPR